MELSKKKKNFSYAKYIEKYIMQICGRITISIEELLLWKNIMVVFNDHFFFDEILYEYTFVHNCKEQLFDTKYLTMLFLKCPKVIYIYLKNFELF